MSLSHGKQRTKINHSHNSWEEILFGVGQGSILGPMLFNIFLSDLFPIIQGTDIASYTDNNSMHKACNNVDGVIAYLQLLSEKCSK